MAGIFTPSGDADLAVGSRPQVSPTGSALEAVAKIGGGLFSGMASAPSSSSGGAASVDYTPALREISSLYASGNNAQAKQVERNLAVSLLQQGVNLDSNFRDAYETVVGRTAEFAMPTAEDREREALVGILETEEGRNGVLVARAKKPDAPSEVILQDALSYVAEEAAFRQDIQRRRARGETEWWNETREAFVTRVDRFESRMMGGLVALQEAGEPLTPDTFDQSLVELQAFQSTLLSDRPANVPENEWKRVVGDKVEAMRTMLTSLRGMVTNEAVANRVARNLANMAREGGTVEDLIAAQALLGNEAAMTLIEAGVVSIGDHIQALRNLPLEELGDFDNVFSDTMVEVYSQGQTADNTAVHFGIIETPARFRDAWQGQIERDGAEISLATLRGMSAMSNSISFDSPETVKGFFNAAGVTLAGFRQIHEGSTVARYRDLTKVLSPQMVQNILTLRYADPERAAVLRSWAYDTADTARSVLAEQVKTVEDDTMFTWRDGAYVIDPDKVSKMVEEGKIEASDAVIVERLLRDRYNGDVLRMVQDAERFRSSPTDLLDRASDRSVFISVMSQDSNISLLRLGDARKSIQYLEGVQRRLRGPREQTVPTVPEPSGFITDKTTGRVTAVPQSLGSPLADAEPQYQPLLDLIDRTEGLGSYDKLFANSEGGRFSGVKVTDMTVGEVLDFQSPSGEYASFVNQSEGVISTPVGRYQIVGDTLRDAVTALGIPEDTRFTPEVQDQVFKWLVNRRLERAGGDVDEAVRQMRLEWAGLGVRGVTDEDVRAAVEPLIGGTRMASSPAPVPRPGSEPGEFPEGGEVAAAGIDVSVEGLAQVVQDYASSTVDEARAVAEWVSSIDIGDFNTPKVLTDIGKRVRRTYGSAASVVSSAFEDVADGVQDATEAASEIVSEINSKRDLPTLTSVGEGMVSAGLTVGAMAVGALGGRVYEETIGFNPVDDIVFAGLPSAVRAYLVNFADEVRVDRSWLDEEESNILLGIVTRSTDGGTSDRGFVNYDDFGSTGTGREIQEGAASMASKLSDPNWRLLNLLGAASIVKTDTGYAVIDTYDFNIDGKGKGPRSALAREAFYSGDAAGYLSAMEGLTLMEKMRVIAAVMGVGNKEGAPSENLIRIEFTDAEVGEYALRASGQLMDPPPARPE